MRRTACWALATTAMLAAHAPAHADQTTSGMTMYGISQSNGDLVRYRFDDQQAAKVGPVKTNAGTLKGIDASAYIPGFQNIYAFWTGPDGGDTRLVYVDTESARASLVGQPLDKGKVTGAVAALTTGDESWMTNLTDQKAVAGLVNINPSNSSNNEFTLTTADGDVITRDDLHHAHVNGDGTCFAGTATNVRIKPKGNGNNNTFSLGGQAYPLQNGTTYLITGSMDVRLYNDHAKNGRAMGHWWLQFTGGTALVQDGSGPPAPEDGDDPGEGAHKKKWIVFALQNIKAGKDEVPFTIDDDKVINEEPAYAKVTVLGSAITYGGQYDLAVTTRLLADGHATDAWGGFGQPRAGNVNDHQNPRTYVFPDKLPANTPITVVARSWQHDGYSWRRRPWRRVWNWSSFLYVNSSNSDSRQLRVLRDGNPVPNMGGFRNQNDVTDYLRDYIDQSTHTIVLDKNQAIFLFELGTSDMSSSAADFQDLVVLVTLAKDKSDFNDANGDDDDSTPLSRLIMVDHQTGGFKQVMTLNHIYHGLAWSSRKLFYATVGNQLYRLDPRDQTETLVGSMSRDHMLGLEFLGSHLTGFETDANQLHALNTSEDAGGADTESPLSFSSVVSGLGTIVYVPTPKDPARLPDAYD